MADSINNVDDVILIRELPNKTSISASDLYLSQTDLQSFKLSHGNLIASIPDNETIKVDPITNKLKVEGSILKQAYPVGSIYTNAFDDRNPRDILGFGIWSRIGEGKVLIGEGVGTDINQTSKSFAAGSSGGEYEHQLTEDEMPSHTHPVTTGGFGVGGVTYGPSEGANHWEGGVAGSRRGGTAQPTGGDQPHNNTQPYTTVYMWKREQEINPDEPINSTPVSNWVVDTNIFDGVDQNHDELVSSKAVKDYVDSTLQVVNRKRVEYSGQKSTTNTTPLYDNSVPLFTEGDVLMSTDFQPSSTSNRLCVKFEGLIANSTPLKYIILSLFEGTTCVGVTAFLQPHYGITITNVSFEFIPSNTNNSTYTLRWGIGGGTAYVNRYGSSYNPTFGGFMKSYLTIEEISDTSYEIYTD